MADYTGMRVRERYTGWHGVVVGMLGMLMARVRWEEGHCETDVALTQVEVAL